MRLSRFTVVVLAVLSFSAAGSEPAQGTSEANTSFGLYAKPSGQRTMLTLTLGNNISRLVQVYSEPSHTLIVAFVDNGEGDPRDTAWYRGLPRGGRMLFPFGPAKRANFEAEPAPPSDTHIQVRVFGRFPGENEPTERVYTARVNVREFGFNVRERGTLAGPGVIICCERDPDDPGNQCTTGCSSCPAGTAEFTCCTTKDDAQTCGWCNKTKAYCGTQECPGCG